MDILELSERLDLQRFHSHTLALYRSVCALGNNRVAHALCSHVDQAQLLHALEDAHLPGPLRAGYYDLLISIHLESACRSRRSMLSEYIVPLTPETRAITLFPPGRSAEDGPRRHGLPGVGVTTSLRPPHHFSPPCFVAALPAAGAAEAPARLSPAIPLEALRDKALRMLGEAVRDGGQHARDPVGGSVEFQFVPVLKLVSTLLVMAPPGSPPLPFRTRRCAAVYVFISHPFAHSTFQFPHHLPVYIHFPFNPVSYLLFMSLGISPPPVHHLNNLSFVHPSIFHPLTSPLTYIHSHLPTHKYLQFSVFLSTNIFIHPSIHFSAYQSPLSTLIT